MWVKTTASGTGNQWYSGRGLVDGYVKKNTADWGTSVLNGKFAFGVGTPDTTVSSSATINDGNWHHLAATRDGTSGAMNVYADGTLSGSGTGPTSALTSPPYLRLGCLQTGANFLGGTTDEVCLYNRVLGQAEIAALSTTPALPVTVASDTSVSLVWNTPSPYATGFNVKRSAVPGGPYAAVASVTSTTDTDTGLTNGIPYYYVVSAMDSGVETPNSAPASTTPHSTYASWQALYFNAAQLANPAVSGANGDTNGNGIKNIVAYAFNLSPWVSIVGDMPVPQIIDGYLTISYTQRKAPTDVSYAVAVSGDLADWNRGTAYTTQTNVTSIDANTERVSVRANSPVSAGAQFMRVEIGY